MHSADLKTAALEAMWWVTLSKTTELTGVTNMRLLLILLALTTSVSAQNRITYTFTPRDASFQDLICFEKDPQKGLVYDFCMKGGAV
jgi:hypothetical protein